MLHRERRCDRIERNVLRGDDLVWNGAWRRPHRAERRFEATAPRRASVSTMTAMIVLKEAVVNSRSLTPYLTNSQSTSRRGTAHVRDGNEGVDGEWTRAEADRPTSKHKFTPRAGETRALALMAFVSGIRRRWFIVSLLRGSVRLTLPAVPSSTQSCVAFCSRTPCTTRESGHFGNERGSGQPTSRVPLGSLKHTVQ